jgi:hypothetical protein
MQAHVEFIFRPRNVVVRFLAWLIGAPTCGIIRSGPLMDHFGADYDLAVFFVAPDDKTAELKGLSSPVQHAHFKAIKRAGAAEGLKIRWDRRKAGRIVKIDPQYALAVAA